MLCVTGIALNLVLNRFAALAGIPLYLDSVGTVFTAVVGGYLPGILVGFLTNVLLWILGGSVMTIYYGVISVLIAVLAAFLSVRDWYRSFGRALCSVPLLALIGGGLGSLLTFGLYGLSYGEELSADLARFFYNSGLKSIFWAQLSGDFLIDLADKLAVVVIVFLLLRLIPADTQTRMRLRFWQQSPLSAEDRKASRGFPVRSMSLRPKFLLLATGGMIIVAASKPVARIVKYAA